MRGGRKLVASLVAVAALLSVTSGVITPSHAQLSQTQRNQLIAQRAQLVAQLQSLLAAQGGAQSALGAAEAQYMAAQQAVLSVRTQLDSTNATLARLQSEIASEQQTDQRAQLQLALLTRASYESTANRSMIANLLSSNSLNDAMSQAKDAASVTGDVQDLQTQLSTNEAALAQQRQALQAQFAQASQLEGQLSSESNRFLAAVESRNQALANASAPVRAIEAEIAAIDNELAGNMSPVNGGASCGNHFAYGQCTWYVATRRCIPWSGNANQWYGNAAAMGYLEGHQPAVGAVVVFWPGGDGASSVGHVGYVEEVVPASGVPAGYFKFSEMNFAGWDKVDYRVLPNNSSGIQGFIYGHK